MVTGFDVAWSTLAKAPTGGSYTTCPDCGKRYQGAGPCPFCNTPGGKVSDISKGGGLHANDPQRKPWYKSAGVRASPARIGTRRASYHGGPRGGPRAHKRGWTLDDTAHTKDFQAVDRRNLAPGQRPPHYSNLNQGGHLSGPAMSDQDWDFYDGYGSADQRGLEEPWDQDFQHEYDDLPWNREGGVGPIPNTPYNDEDEEQVYGKYLAEQRQKERQGVMDEGIPDPRESGQGREPLPQGYEYGNEGRIRRMPPPEIPMNPFKKAWDYLKKDEGGGPGIENDPPLDDERDHDQRKIIAWGEGDENNPEERHGIPIYQPHSKEEILDLLIVHGGIMGRMHNAFGTSDWSADMDSLENTGLFDSLNHHYGEQDPNASDEIAALQHGQWTQQDPPEES